jgi:hypothetical protein
MDLEELALSFVHSDPIALIDVEPGSLEVPWLVLDFDRGNDFGGG